MPDQSPQRTMRHLIQPLACSSATIYRVVHGRSKQVSADVKGNDECQRCRITLQSSLAYLSGDATRDSVRAPMNVRQRRGSSPTGASWEGSHVGSVLIQLLPLAIGSMMMPTWILLVLSLLKSEHGQVGAVAFVGGVTTVRLLQSITFSSVIAVDDVTSRTSEMGTIVSTLQLVLGILMWAAALKQVYAQDEPDAWLAKWMTLIATLTPVRAFGLGALLVSTSARAWLFILAAIGVIGQARLSAVQSIVAFLLYLLGAQLLLTAPIFVTLWAPERFGALADWLQARDRPVTIAVSLVVGGFFLWRGASGLIG
jgi:Sap, sulfolipid-1-addressing protein